jgi:hypothetical protein
MRTKQTQDWTTIFKSSSILEAPQSVDEFYIVAPGVTCECFRIESRHEKLVLQKAKICGGCFAYENAGKSLGRNNLFHVQPGSRNVALLSVRCIDEPWRSCKKAHPAFFITNPSLFQSVPDGLEIFEEAEEGKHSLFDHGNTVQSQL